MELVCLAFLGKSSFTDIDHIDGIRSNNELSNLRYCSHRLNTSLGFLRLPKTSKYTGVHYDKSRSRWVANIQIKGKTKRIGRFDFEIDAHNAYQNELSKIEAIQVGENQIQKSKSNS